jgi:cytochrome c oxidase assembly factor CtaG
MIPYLLLADLQNTALSAILAFSDRVIYPVYASVPRIGTISTLQDQAVAGVIMWLSGAAVFLVMAVWLVVDALAHADRNAPPTLALP